MNQAKFEHDEAQTTTTVTRRYNTTRSRVWQAWTDAALLDLWWGPKPWNAVTQSFDFSEGGHRHYCMRGPEIGPESGPETGPETNAHWCMEQYHTIDPENSFTATDFFCNAQGERETALPSNHWTIRFIDHIAWTDLIATIKFDSLADMRKLLAMGFQEGFAAGLQQLAEVLSTPKASNKHVSWKIQIDAPPALVWKNTFDKQAFAEWTAAFSPGSYYAGEWQEGELLRFLAPGQAGAKPSGMLSVVRELRAPEFSSLEHLGFVVEGRDDTASAGARNWAPAFENYTLKARAGGTEFIVDMDITADYASMFDVSWPQALQNLKTLCERQS